MGDPCGLAWLPFEGHLPCDVLKGMPSKGVTSLEERLAGEGGGGLGKGYGT